MLKQYFKSHKHKHNTAEKLRTAFIFHTEAVTYRKADTRQHKRDNSDYNKG